MQRNNSNKEQILDIGCGGNKVPGSIGIDIKNSYQLILFMT
jgi:hypothetical protein